jgi:MYXO-CTERM domain-containing protein
VCCDTTCTNSCNSCRAANKESHSAEGTCGPRDHSQYIGTTACPSSAQSTCGTQGGYCDGKGACAYWDTSTPCVSGSCADGDTQNNQRNCDGKGACAALTTSDCAAGYACKTVNQASQCVASCSDDSYCTSNYYCQYWATPFNTCQPRKSAGKTCSNNSTTECASGFCVDGVCCDKACNGTCEGCTNALTGQTTGACKPITAATDPQGDCSDFGAGTCSQNGLCSGSASCQLYASGTQCADVASCASETSRNVPDTCNGTGTCVDRGSVACNTGYACVAGSCQTTCTTDAHCASAYWCDTVNKVCAPDRDLGQSCSKDATCKGNANCVEGVCCNTACTGNCQSCLKANTGLDTDGTCANVLDDLDPKDRCEPGAGYPKSCAAPGLCNGQGACRAFAKDTVECDDDACSDSTLTTYTCNGAGTCKAKSVQCNPFKCDVTNNLCRVACSSNAECIAGSFCDKGTCVGQLGIGKACTGDAQCKQGTFCANIGEGVLEGDLPLGEGGAPNEPTTELAGVCCDQVCSGTCQGCKRSIKGEGSDGTCGNVVNGTDPANDCPADASNACGNDGFCDGKANCRKAPDGASCGITSCKGNSVRGQICNGNGDCVNEPAGTDCAPYLCRDVSGAFQCTNPCSEDNDCQDGYFCTNQICSKKLANGKVCESNGVCNSDYCVDGVCCDASCNGQCEACAAPGSEGTCTPIQGAPHGSRPQCDHAGEECGGLCDGVNAAACKYAANGTNCGNTTCDNDLAKSSACNGQGECKANKNTECSPYVCGTDDTCLERCEQDADCSQGYACDETTQRCLPSAVAATCSEDRLTSVGQNGQSTPCKPFLCVPASGTCAVSCAFTTDCSPEFVCEPSTKTCLPAPTDDGAVADESCACRAAGAAPSRSGYLALAALGVALTGLRRRQRWQKSSATRALQPTE